MKCGSSDHHALQLWLEYGIMESIHKLWKRMLAMRDLELAVKLLNNENYTCVLCKGEQFYTSRQKGISPMLDWIDSGADLQGFSAADKIVGKAAAMLFVLAGIRSVHAQVLSELGKQVLEQHGIDVSYSTLTKRIINRNGDGICPMEGTVADIHTPHEAITAIRCKRDQLRKGE